MTSQRINGNNNIQAGRDVNVNISQGMQPLKNAIAALVSAHKDDPDFVGFIEELSSFMSDNPQRTIVGLEAKLDAAGREDLTRYAIELKEKFHKKLTKDQLSTSRQQAYVQILSYIRTSFLGRVRPLISSGDQRAVDHEIHNIVVDIYSQTSETLYDITTEHILGMLYYLTGKCHLEWA